MGLDQFAYSIDDSGEKVEFAYWRKHPNLQGFMENLWNEKGCPGKSNEPDSLVGMSDFNCIPVELTHEDLDNLEKAVKGSDLPETGGFFFGSDKDDDYYQQDLEFISKAREALDAGLSVYYDSWW